MKKYLLVAALVMASTSAMADRTVSGVTQGGYGTYNSKTVACESAKEVASKKRESNEQVEKYSKCECEKERDGLNGDKWTCSVEATLEKK